MVYCGFQGQVRKLSDVNIATGTVETWRRIGVTLASAFKLFLCVFYCIILVKTTKIIRISHILCGIHGCAKTTVLFRPGSFRSGTMYFVNILTNLMDTRMKSVRILMSFKTNHKKLQTVQRTVFGSVPNVLQILVYYNEL